MRDISFDSEKFLEKKKYYVICIRMNIIWKNVEERISAIFLQMFETILANFSTSRLNIVENFK